MCLVGLASIVSYAKTKKELQAELAEAQEKLKIKQAEALVFESLMTRSASAKGPGESSSASAKHPVKSSSALSKGAASSKGGSAVKVKIKATSKAPAKPSKHSRKEDTEAS